MNRRGFFAGVAGLAAAACLPSVPATAVEYHGVRLVGQWKLVTEKINLNHGGLAYILRRYEMQGFPNVAVIPRQSGFDLLQVTATNIEECWLLETFERQIA
jgi:hypothetical protein